MKLELTYTLYWMAGLKSIRVICNTWQKISEVTLQVTKRYQMNSLIDIVKCWGLSMVISTLIQFFVNKPDDDHETWELYVQVSSPNDPPFGFIETFIYYRQISLSQSLCTRWKSLQDQLGYIESIQYFRKWHMAQWNWETVFHTTGWLKQNEHDTVFTKWYIVARLLS